MSVVDFLKSVGGVTVPKDVIEQANRSDEKVEGRLILNRLPSGNVLMTFTPNQGQGNSRPLLAKDTGQAASDLAATFGFSQAEARAQIAELEATGQADMTISVDGRVASKLFLYRPLERVGKVDR